MEEYRLCGFLFLLPRNKSSSSYKVNIFFHEYNCNLIPMSLPWHRYLHVVGGFTCLNDPEGDANRSFGSCLLHMLARRKGRGQTVAWQPHRRKRMLRADNTHTLNFSYQRNRILVSPRCVQHVSKEGITYIIVPLLLLLLLCIVDHVITVPV
jgi:hypothetical protein